MPELPPSYTSYFEFGQFHGKPMSLPGNALIHHYPWNQLHSYIEADQTIPLLGYGSLMNRASASRVLCTETLSTARSVIAWGARRIYNTISLNRKTYAEYCHPSDSDYGVLNAMSAAGHWFNAVEYQVRQEDIQFLRTREKAYDLIPVWISDCSTPTESNRWAYFFSRRQSFWNETQILFDAVVPLENYHQICETGCREIADDFLEMFRHSTWIMNGNQSLSISEDMPNRSLPTDAVVLKAV